MKTLMLRTCNQNLQSWGFFQWPESGPVVASDWNPEPKCGGGLHGLPWGEGDGSLLDNSPTARWLVFEAAEVVMIGTDKAKAPSGTVVFCGTVEGATNYIRHHPHYRGQAVAYATSIQHHSGVSDVVGYKGTCIVGDYGRAVAGNRGLAKAGLSGTATAGNGGIAIVGTKGTATAGNAGTATAGDAGTATAGNAGIAQAGIAGEASGDIGCEIRIQWCCLHDHHDHLYYTRLAVGRIGQQGLRPHQLYRVDDDGGFMPAPRRL